MKKTVLILFFAIFSFNNCNAQQFYYTCYYNSHNPTNMISKLSIVVNDNFETAGVYYKGKKDAIKIVYFKTTHSSNGMRDFSYSYYKEIYKGKVTGYYIFEGADDKIEYQNLRTKKSTTYYITNYSLENPDSKEPCFDKT